MVEEVNRTRTINQEALAVDVVEVFLSALSTAVCSSILLISLLIYADADSHFISSHVVNRTVVVDGLPSSASWQDLKVLELYMTSVCTFFLYTTFNFTYSGSHEMGWRCLFF